LSEGLFGVVGGVGEERFGKCIYLVGVKGVWVKRNVTWW
jgi:hypothetical protein